jgi:hypothetical protein
MLFRAELLTIIYIDLLASIYNSKVSLNLVYSYSSHGTNINKLIVSSISILIFFNISTT